MSGTSARPSPPQAARAAPRLVTGPALLAALALLAGLALLPGAVVAAPLPPAPTPSAAAMTASDPAPAPAQPPAPAPGAAPGAARPIAGGGPVVEQLRLRVPAGLRQAWLEAERDSWEPWLARQEGFLGRELFWDPEREEATLLIRWASRGQWKAIPTREVEAVQERFERIARQATGAATGNPFPLVFQGELEPQ